MHNLEAHKLLEASPLFRNLRPQEAAAISARLQPASYTQGQRILERGAWHGRLHIVASGQVSVLLREDEEADEAQSGDSVDQHQESSVKQVPRSYVIAHLGPGECFGEMSLITGEPPTATIVAEQDTQLWSLAQSDFLTLTGTCPTLLHNINAILSQRLARANRQILASHSAERIWLALLATPTASDASLE
ncbi:MAG: cyclic nucleotide-binding domain-containing protein, partial [Ktedonobacteraceae bacterium]